MPRAQQQAGLSMKPPDDTWQPSIGNHDQRVHNRNRKRNQKPQKPQRLPPPPPPTNQNPSQIAEMDVDEELETLIQSQRQELMAARSVESDLDLAYRLQIQEAMAASLSNLPSSSSAPPPLPPTEEIPSVISLQTLELDRFHQEKEDAQISQLERSRAVDGLRVRAHDEKFAREIDLMPEEEWEDWGDEFERPMAKGEERPVRVYFKGIESNEMVKGRIVKLAGIGVAICDESDRVVLKISKPLPSAVNCREAVEVKALIEALDALVGLGVKKIDVFVDYRALYCHITGKWIVKQRKVVNLMNRVELLKRNFTQVNVYFAPRWDVKLAFKLARDAIESQLTKNVELSGNKDVQEACTICLEDNEPSQMFAVDGCLHRFCFSCMKQHVEVKLLHGLLPSCPHEGCKIRLNVESCRKFLTPKLLGIMIQRVKEESIPVTEKIYCPYPKCSALMSLNEAIRPKMESSSKQPAYGTSGLRKCIQCNGSFCISCKVPWHERMSCSDYKRLNPQKHGEEVKLKALARQKLWRQCVKCNHMIELAEGCFHMTCRCGYEFCYTCGAEWKNKKATCACPLWVEQNILYDYSDDDSDDYDDVVDDDDYDDDDYDLYGGLGSHYGGGGIPRYYLL